LLKTILELRPLSYSHMSTPPLCKNYLFLKLFKTTKLWF